MATISGIIRGDNMKKTILFLLCLMMICPGCDRQNGPKSAETYPVYYISVLSSATFEEQMLCHPIDQETDVYFFDDLVIGNIPSYQAYCDEWRLEIEGSLQRLSETMSEDVYSHLLQGQAAWEDYADGVFAFERGMYDLNGAAPSGMLFPTVWLMRGIRMRARAMELYGYEYLLTGTIPITKNNDPSGNSRCGEKTELSISVLPLEKRFDSELAMLLTDCLPENETDYSIRYDSLCEKADALMMQLSARLSEDTATELRAAEAAWRSYAAETYTVETLLLQRADEASQEAELAREKRGCSRVAEILSCLTEMASRM